MPIVDANAESIRDLARRYSTTAAELSSVTQNATNRLNGMSWEGGAANQARGRQRDRSGRARRLAEEMAELSRLLMRHADEVDRIQDDLRRLESRIRAWAAANPPDPSTPLPDESLITWWPPRHHTGWYDLERLLRSRGAVF